MRLPTPGPGEPPGPVVDDGSVAVPAARTGGPGASVPWSQVVDDPARPPTSGVDDTSPFVGIAGSATTGRHPAPPGVAGRDPLDGASTAQGERHARLHTPRRPSRRRTILRRVLAVVLTLLLLGVSALAVYLYLSAQAWRDRATDYLGASLELGEDLSTTRSELSWAQAELEAVQAQLDTAHERIIELANEKNQLGDEREITQQLVDYQKRVSDAAGEVADALDRCVQGQQQLIGYLQASAQPGGPVYDPVELSDFETNVEALCQAASEANIALQDELDK